MTSKLAYASAHRASEQELIEQRIARGWSVVRIASDLGVTVERVHRAWDYLDELVAT